MAEPAATADVPTLARNKAADMTAKAQATATGVSGRVKATAAGLSGRVRPSQLAGHRWPLVLAIGLVAAASVAVWHPRPVQHDRRQPGARRAALAQAP